MFRFRSFGEDSFHFPQISPLSTPTTSEASTPEAPFGLDWNPYQYIPHVTEIRVR